MRLPPEAFAELLVGTPYRVVARIGQGGMGEVFEVEHELLGRRMVAKILHARLANDPGFVERMRVEAQSTARLRHPNIVQVNDFCTTSTSRPCLIMEKLRGHTLAQELAQHGWLSIDGTFKIAEQLLSALSAAHRLGVVHRDLKPENLFLHTGTDGVQCLKVLDFGFARILPSALARAPQPAAIPTGTGRLVGTPGFVPPEALMGQPVDHRGDLYAVGLLLFAMLVGHGPFDHLTAEATLSHAPVPPSRFRNEPGVSALDVIVVKALKKKPGERHQSADEFASELVRLRESLPLQAHQ